MFYSQFILAKKGPLGTIWIAAHLERKLRKNQVAETDIGVTVDNILFPEVPIALRLSGHLLLGVVRIYSRQVNYLFNDCSETLGKIKQAFHSAAVDLPPEATTAPFHTITLPETFDFDELELGPDSDTAFLHLNGNYVDHHVTTREQITLQDCIENNPYLGSSQFGLDERFGDGSYSSLGLDFDEEFLASKAGSSFVASTSTPLLKADTVVPLAGGENEVTHMDTDDPYEQPLHTERQKGKSIREAVNIESGEIDRDKQPSTSIPAISLALFSEPVKVEVASRKDSDSTALKHDTPSFHTYTPRVLEACTPDLNQEYCPPDEPSTPALVDETSLPMYKECPAESARKVLPVTSGNTECSSFSKVLPVSSSPQQVSCFNTGASSVQAISNPSPASFQGFPLQQAALVDTNRDALLIQKEKSQFYTPKENTASASMPSQNFPQLTFIQQTRKPVSHEGAVFPAETSQTSSMSPEAPFSSSHQRDATLSMTMNHQSAGTVNQEVHPCFQQQGVTVCLQNPGPSSAAMVEQAGTVNQEVNIHVQKQGLAVDSQNLVSSFPAMVEKSGTVNQGVNTRVQQESLAVGSQNMVKSSAAMIETAGTVNQEENTHVQQQGLAAGSQNPASSFGATMGLAGTVSQEVKTHFQQEGLAVGPHNQMSSFGAMIGSAGTKNQQANTCLKQQGLAAGSQNPVSSFGPMIGSAGTVNQDGNTRLQHQGLGAGLQNPVSSVGAMIWSAGNVNQEVNMHFQQQDKVNACFQQQGLAVGSQNPVPSFGAMNGSEGATNQEVNTRSQQQGFSAGSQNPVSPFESMIGSAGAENQEVNTCFQLQGLAAGLQSPVSSFGAMTGPARTTSCEVNTHFEQQGLTAASQNPVSSFVSMTGSAGTINYEVNAHFQQQDKVNTCFQQQGLEAGPKSSVSTFGAMIGAAGTANQEFDTHFQQQGIAAGSQSSLSSFGAKIGSAGMVNQEVTTRFQQQGLAAGSPNPVSPFGPMVGSARTVNQEGYPNFQQQGFAAGLNNPVSSFAATVISQSPSTMQNIGANQVLSSPTVSGPRVVPSLPASLGSCLPSTNLLPTGAMHEAWDSATSKSPAWQSTAQQHSIPSPAMPGVLSSTSMGECETLRSAYDMQTGNSGFLMRQKAMPVEKIPGLELDRNKSFSVGAHGIIKEATMPAMDKTPLFREVTPYSYTRPPFLSTHSIESLPADDDVLASILGRRSKGFKVASTPQAAKELNVAKRLKRAPRVTPKKRKIELDTVAVLHGDVIRQQLANAEDIRRERRKAPCTRREVWAFIRENEGQENFDEPTLPELSPGLHDLYHDVLHGPESRLLSSHLNDAVKADQISESQLIRTGETDHLVDGLNNDANNLDLRGDGDCSIDLVNKDSNRELCMNEFVGSGANNLSEILAENLNKDAKLEIAPTNPCGGSRELEDVENLPAKEVPEVDSEILAGKARNVNALLNPQGPEDYNQTSVMPNETDANGQAEQIIGPDREVEGPGLAQKTIVVSNLSQGGVIGVVGAVVPDGGIAMTLQKDMPSVVGSDVDNQERPVAMQHDIKRSEEQQKLSFGVHEHDKHEVVVALLSKAADFRGLDTPSDGKDATEVPMPDGKDASEVPVVNVVDIDKDATKVPISDGKDAPEVPVINVVYIDKDATVVQMSDGNDASEMPVINVVDIEKGATEVPMSAEKDSSEVPVINVVDIVKNAKEVPMSNGKDSSEVPVINAVYMNKDATEVPMSDGKDSSEVPVINVVDMDKGNMEGNDKLATPNVTEEEMNRCRDDEEMVAIACEKDTGFLEEDNDVAFAEIDYSSDEQDTSIQDSNGWSARSRNVGRYLKTVFEEMEGNSKRLEQGPTLGLERLLARKTRREAARMFFETLVLKTKDYIHVEQNTAYQDINLYPKSKLMKTEF